MPENEDQQFANQDSPEGGMPPSTPEDLGSREVRAAPQAVAEIELGSDLDPAHRALADAMRIIYRILQGAMVVLLLYYLSTGFMKVNEREQGLRITLGQIQDSEPLSAGAHFSWPEPIGESLKVLTEPQTIELNEAFWLHLKDEEKARAFDTLDRQSTQGLVPGEDGSIITADRNLAHTRWNIRYQIVDARRFISAISESENISDASSQAGILVRKAVERAVVHAAARASLEDVISISGSFKSNVQIEAQSMLDQIGAGISILSASCEEAKPPRVILTDYQAVTTASTEARNALERAQERSNQILNMMVGASHEKLALMIQIYDHLSTGVAADPADIEALCQIVDDPAEMRAAALDGDQFLAEMDKVFRSNEVGGEVAKIISGAQSYSTQLVSKLEEETIQLEAYFEQYEKNPLLVKTQLWQQSIDRIYGGTLENERFLFSPGTKMIRIQLNRDPEFHKKVRERQNRLEALRNEMAPG